MKPSVIAPYLFAAFCLILVFTTRVQSQDASKSAITKWEYLIIDPDDKGGDGERRARLQAQLIPLEREGWEVVDSPYLKGVRYHVVILKRPIP